VAEGSALDLEEALMAAMMGDVAVADKALDTAFAEGANAVQVVRAALRHVQRLHLAALAVAAGAAPGGALDSLPGGLPNYDDPGAQAGGAGGTNSEPQGLPNYADPGQDAAPAAASGAAAAGAASGAGATVAPSSPLAPAVPAVTPAAPAAPAAH